MPDQLVTMFTNSDGHLQIVTDGPESKCPTCGYPERHRIFSDADDPTSKIADGCPSCETPRVALTGPDCRDGKHPACDGRAWDDETDQPADCECDCHKENS